MTLPHGFLDELRDRVSLAQVVGRKVSFDMRRSNPGKGDYWAPCPFHQEKTASFHLDDQKGFYYCFGCHAKGDALNFIRETENVGFMEAVEILAREAGMPIPARDPKEQEKSDRRIGLIDVLEQAVQFFRLRLNTAEGAGARDYLAARGLAPATQDQFEIGFAPDSRTALFRHLSGKGVAPDMIVGAGLAISPDAGGTPYDRFRGRIMFPIRDARGRTIAFGGRAMDANSRAKYLNSPETILFDKGRTLYNFGPARAASGKSGALVVAEGYMDVIALVRAGIGHAVAPLGTAITEAQIALMWRIAPEPVIALDGDSAGLRAAMRLVDLTLPMLAAGKSLRFAIMPEGLDPDDVIKGQGAAAMEALLARARPMVDMLWQRETEGQVFDSPERRAALDMRLKTALGMIADASVRAHYKAALREMRAALFAPKSRQKSQGKWRDRGQGRGDWKTRPPDPATEGAKSSFLGQMMPAGDTAEKIREAVILAHCLTYPAVVSPFETALEKLDLGTAGHGAMRDAILRHADDCAGDPALLRQKITEELGADTVEKLFALRHVQIAPTLRKQVDHDTAVMALAEELAKLEAARGSRAEINEAVQDMAGLVDEGLTWRLGQAAQAREKANRSTLPEGGADAENTENMSKYLQNLIDSEVWVKKKQ